MPIAYVVMVVLVFVCCALTFLGFAATLYVTDADDSWMFRFYGFLAATAGIALSFGIERVARKLDIQRPERGIFEVLLIPGVLVGVAHVVELFFKSSGHGSRPSTVCGVLVGLESLLAMIWLTRLDRREQARTLQRGVV